MQFDLAKARSQSHTRVDKFYVLFMSAIHLGAIAALFCFSWTALLVGVISYLVAGIGITVGYHRLLTHKSFKAPLWLERTFATVGNLALQGGPITWVAQHRQHHRESDKEFDPHNINAGFMWAHMLWVFMRYPRWYEESQRQAFAPDLIKDPYYRFLEKNHYLFPALSGALMFALGGWPAFLWGFCLRIVLMYHSTWFVNSAAHKWGYRPFREEIATNNWWVALLSFGEGWHNNHHAHPTSARHGLRAWEFDASWILIWTLKKLGLVTKVRVPAATELPWKQRARQRTAS
jgi:stearoyl-CoA desaturase (delta-9 desaturase)